MSDSDFEKAIEQQADDPAPYLVYGDWLQSKGDPRGELIAVQGALLNVRRGSELARLKVRERELLTEHKEAFLGPLAEHNDEGIEWFCGFIRNVRLFRSGTHENQLAVLEGPSGRFLHHADSRLLVGCLDGCTKLESLYVNLYRDYVLEDRVCERLRRLHITLRYVPQLRTLPRLEQLGLRTVWPDDINDLIRIVEQHGPKELVLGLRSGPGDPRLFSSVSTISAIITSLNLDAMFNRENLAPLTSLAFPRVRELRIGLDERSEADAFGVLPELPALETVWLERGWAPPPHSRENLSYERFAKSAIAKQMTEFVFRYSREDASLYNTVFEGGYFPKLQHLSLIFGLRYSNYEPFWNALLSNDVAASFPALRALTISHFQGAGHVPYLVRSPLAAQIEELTVTIDDDTHALELIAARPRLPSLKCLALTGKHRLSREMIEELCALDVDVVWKAPIPTRHDD